MGRTRKAEPGGSTVHFMAGIAALAGLFFGYDTGVISGAVLFIKDQYALFSGLEEIVVSVVLVGVGSFTAPLYISEVSPANVRGALVSFNQLAITCGIVFSYIIDYSLSGHQGWRWMFAAGIIPAIV